MQHSIDTVVRSLTRKQDVLFKNVKTPDGQGFMSRLYINRSPSAQQDLGNGSWGKVDFLKKEGFSVSLVGDSSDWKNLIERPKKRKK